MFKVYQRMKLLQCKITEVTTKQGIDFQKDQQDDHFTQAGDSSTPTRSKNNFGNKR